MPAKTISRFPYFAIALIVSIGVFLSYLSICGSWNFDPAAFPKMLAGTADRPYVYRQLIPLISKSVAWLVPQWLIELSQKAPYSLKNTIDSLSQGAYRKEAIITIILMYSSLVGFIFAEKALLKQLEYSHDEEKIVPIVLAILILPLAVFHGYIYDLPQLFLFTVGLLFIVRRQWYLYLLLLAVATLNKETSIFLIVIFALYFFRSLCRKTYFILLAVQAIIYCSVHGLVLYLYRSNPGSSIYWTVEFHIRQYTQYPITFLVTLLLFGAMFFLVFKGWQYKPFFMRISFSVFYLVLILFFMGGREMEFRVFIDILPIFGTLMFPYNKSVQT